MVVEYFKVVQFSITVCIIISALFSIAIFFVYQKPNLVKSLFYECGLNSYSDSRKQVTARFFFVGLLFLIFDMEIIYLYP